MQNPTFTSPIAGGVTLSVRVTVVDVNGDGIDDLHVRGVVGDPGGFFLLDGNGGTTNNDPVAAENLSDIGGGISHGVGHPAGQVRARGDRPRGPIQLTGRSNFE